VVTKQDKQNPKHQAIGYLSRRDHSLHELKQKLLKKGHDEASVEQVMAELQSCGYLDDLRYAQMILRHHYLRGQGPQKIRYLLNQNGVSNEIVSKVFDEFDEDWSTLAKDVRWKRFGNAFKSNERNEMFKEKSKQMRFLMTRGFESDQIQYAIEKIDQTGP
jgi:regulatory protein